MNAQLSESGWMQQQSLEGAARISIDCDQVDLEIEADDTLSGVIQLVGQPAQNTPELTRSGSRVQIKQSGRYRGRVTPLIRVPVERCPELEIKLGKGDLRARGVQSDVTVNMGMGDLTLSDGAGETTASIGKGDVAMARRDGMTTLRLGMGDLAVSQCAGEFLISMGKGDIAMNHSGGARTEVKSGHGDVVINRPSGGSIEIKAGHGDVVISNGEATSMNVETGHGDITSTVRLISGGVAGYVLDEENDEDIHEVFDEVTLSADDIASIADQVGAAVDDISFDGLQFEANDHGVSITRGDREVFRAGPDGIQIRTGNREIRLGSEGIRLGGGTIPARSGEQFRFETGRGDVRIDLPNDLNMRVEALVTGDIRSDIPLVGVGRPGPRGSTKRFVGVTDNAGGTSPRVDVRARTRRGDVTIRSVSVEPRIPVPVEPAQRDVDRDEQARVILEALARGELTVHEADRLLEGLELGD